MIEDLKAQWKNPIVKFVVKAGLVYVLWEMLNWLWMHNSSVATVWLYLHDVIRTNIMDVSVFALKAMGYTIERFGIVIRIVGTSGVAVGPACVGFGLLFGFTGLILAYHGSAKDKLWFIPLGLLGIHLINIARIVILTIISKINNDWVEFNHKYVFNTLVYIFIFILWINWVKRVEKLEKSKLPAEPAKN